MAVSRLATRMLTTFQFGAPDHRYQAIPKKTP